MLASVTGVPPRSGCWGKIFQRSCPNPPILPQNHVASDSPDQCLTASDLPQATAGCACRAAIPFAILQRAVRSVPPSSGDRLRSHSSENQWPSRRSRRFAVLWGPATPSSCDPIEPYQFPRPEGAASDRSSVLATSNRVRSAAGMRRFFFAGWPVDCPLPIAPLAEHSPRFLG
ncbi:hypothetical protein SV7mr_35590 [Stieleria bergensis]|uniref:Uncharacterized protein n=1 Tax=Stieleria bergensis TaxID=2528025 RepID=A0A517SY06_9BACT|nr:hypothetical protein SV7mr_35590 [Planctomycetes bacterium SV_7m_r]